MEDKKIFMKQNIQDEKEKKLDKNRPFCFIDLTLENSQSQMWLECFIFLKMHLFYFVKV